MSDLETVKVGLLTVSDRAFQKIYEDKSGPAMKNWLLENIRSPLEILQEIVPDEEETIKQKMVEWVDQKNCRLILTSGGTGPAIRDVTPEATLSVADKVLDGFGERMRAISLKYVPTAILSRQVAVIRKKCLIINLPGRPRSIQETLQELFVVIPYSMQLIGGTHLQTDEQKILAFFPKG